MQPFSLAWVSPGVCWQRSRQWCLFPHKENEENQIFISQEGIFQPFVWNRACYSLLDHLRQAAITHETQFPLCAGFFSPRAPPWSPSPAGSSGPSHTQGAGSLPGTSSQAKLRGCCRSITCGRTSHKHWRGIGHRSKDY